MSDFSEEIIERMHTDSALRNESNQMRKILDYTIGEWLQRKDDFPFLNMFFIQEATGKYLDLFGKDFRISRKIDESDDDYRERIILESLGHLTVEYLKELFNINAYVFVENFSVTENTLTSDNEYISQKKCMLIATDDLKQILEKKFVLGSEVIWLTL